MATELATDRRLRVADVMICALASEIADGDFVGVGLGTPLALTAALLARQTHALDSHVLAAGALDAHADLSTYLGGTRRLLGRTTSFVSHFDSMDMAERQTMTLQFLRPAQADRVGNLNTSRIGPRENPSMRFPGGLATGDVMSLLPRIVAYIPNHRARSLPERLGYITGRSAPATFGLFEVKGVVAIVTDLACFQVEGGQMKVRSLHPWTTKDEVIDETGFAVDAATVPFTTPEPSPAQHAALQALDPMGLRATEIRHASREVSSR